MFSSMVNGIDTFNRTTFGWFSMFLSVHSRWGLRIFSLSHARDMFWIFHLFYIHASKVSSNVSAIWFQWHMKVSALTYAVYVAIALIKWSPLSDKGSSSIVIPKESMNHPCTLRPYWISCCQKSEPAADRLDCLQQATELSEPLQHFTAEVTTRSDVAFCA